MFVTVDRLAFEGRVDVEDDVDTDGVEDGNTLVMVECGVHVVTPDGIHAQGLHQGSISQACLGVAERIALASAICALSAWLVVDTQQHKTITGCGVDKLLIPHFDGVQGGGRCREGTEAWEKLGRVSSRSMDGTVMGCSRTYRILSALLWFHARCSGRLCVVCSPEGAGVWIAKQGGMTDQLCKPNVGGNVVWVKE
jgi:hypothetical protein